MVQVTMKELDGSSIPKVKEYDAKTIRSIRTKTGYSQPAFAACLNISKSTVSQLERGEKTPSGPTLKLLNLVQRKGIDWINH